MSTPQKALSPLRPGFSMIELMVVIVVIAIMAMMAVPSLMSITPYARARLEAQNAATIMRQARLKAASTQRPTRVLLHCQAHAADVHQPCVFTMQGAIYAGGAVAGWAPVPVAGQQGAHQLHPSIRARMATGSAAAVTPSSDSIFWAIFMPSSQVFVSHAPFALEFLPEQFVGDTPERGRWALSVNRSTGRTTLNRLPD